MKAVGQNKMLTRTPSDVLSQNRVDGLRYCVKLCIGTNDCLSINYKNQPTTEQSLNCQLLKFTSANESVRLSEAFGWVHYEPVLQVCLKTN